MLGSLGPMELAIIALIVILLFGAGKVSGLGKDLGTSIKEFRKAVKDEDPNKAQQQQMQSQQYQPQPPQQVAPPPQYAPPPPQQQYAPPPPPQEQPVQPGDPQKHVF